MVPGPTTWQNIHGSQINFEPDSSATFSAPLLPLINPMDWDGRPPHPRAQSSTIPDGLTPILRFLHSSPACLSGADLQATVVPLQIADLQSFGAGSDKLVSWYLPPGSVGSAQVGALRSEKEALTVVLRTWEDLFAECTRSMWVCVLVIVWDGHCSVCAATGMETALSETHDPRVGRPFQHAREYFPPAMFHFQSDFCCLDVSFSIRFVFSRSLWIKRPIGFWLEGEASPIYFSLTSQNTGHTIV